MFYSMLNPISNKTIELILNVKEKDLNSRVSTLEAIIIEQNKKIILMEERLKKLESIKEKLWRKEINDRIRYLNKEEEDLLLYWLPKKSNKITLLLNSNKDGDSTTSFMNKCNGKFISFYAYD